VIYVREAEGRVVKTTRGKRVPSGIFSIDETCPYWKSFLRTGDLLRATDEEIAAAKTVKATKPAPASAPASVPTPAATPAVAVTGDK